MLEGYKAMVNYVHEKARRLYTYEAMRKAVHRDPALRAALVVFNGTACIESSILDEWIGRVTVRTM